MSNPGTRWHSRWYASRLSGATLLAGVGLATVLVGLMAEDFRITDFSLDATGKIRLRHLADANSYYILNRGDTVVSIALPVDLKLGQAGQGELTDPSTISPQPSS